MDRFYILDKFGVRWAKVYTNYVYSFLMVFIGAVGLAVSYFSISEKSKLGFGIGLLTIIALILLGRGQRWMRLKINDHIMARQHNN